MKKVKNINRRALFNFQRLCFTVFVIAGFCLSLTITADELSKKSLLIGFGSCSNQNWEQPIWSVIEAQKPDLFIMMGDMVYAESADQQVIANAYKKAALIPEFHSFKHSTPMIGTWDDHDYGISNSGRDFSGKYGSKEEFIKFFNYPELNATKNKDSGIFHSKWLTLNNKKIQIILLDTRWYRSSLEHTYLTEKQRIALNLGPLQPTQDKSATILGSEQWLWLESELKKPADLKILVSSIQVIAEFTGWEAWANYPLERTKLFNMLDEYVDENKFIILSGEIHRSEISRQTFTTQSYLDVTSSGLAVNTYPSALNVHRQGGTYDLLNYGMLTITDSEKHGLQVNASIYDANGKQQLTANLKRQSNQN